MAATVATKEGDQKVDVVVIGGGISGLTAAYHLKKRDPDLHVVVLEGKDRVGGRTLTVEIQAAHESGKDSWDLGGQWIGRTQPDILRTMEELGLEKYEQFHQGTKYMQLNGKMSTYKSAIPSLGPLELIDFAIGAHKIERMLDYVSVEDPGQSEYAEEWDSMTFETFKKRTLWTRAAGELIDAGFRTVFGAETSQMSLLYVLAYIKAAGGIHDLTESTKNGGQEYKIKGGSQQVSEKLAERIGTNKVLLDHPVIAITQNEEEVEVRTLNNLTFHCKRVVMAIPPHQADKILYDPPLPPEKQHVFSRMPVGYVIKFIITYPTAFWRSNGYSGEIVSSGGPSEDEDCTLGPVNLAFDGTTCNGSPALVGFLAGEQGVQWGRKTVAERRCAVIDHLSDFLGTDALDYLEYVEKDWRDEPYNGGCPVSVGTTGIMTYFAPALRDPFERLHFAGTESARVWCGFMNGAVESGVRAATEVLHNLTPESVTADELLLTAYGPKYEPPRRRRRHILRCTIIIGTVAVLVIGARKMYNS